VNVYVSAHWPIKPLRLRDEALILNPAMARPNDSA
jgi:hypothetical protein